MVLADGSVGSCEVTEPVCHQQTLHQILPPNTKRVLTSCRSSANASSRPAGQAPTRPHFPKESEDALAEKRQDLMERREKPDQM
jgi:hypothetical protein